MVDIINLIFLPGLACGLLVGGGIFLLGLGIDLGIKLFK